MNVKRGDVVLTWYPFASGKGGKRRPCVVIQNDDDNVKIANTVVAQITGVLHRRGDKSHVFIDAASPEGKLAGILHDSLVSCNNLATIEQSLIEKVSGSLDPATMHQVNNSLKAALELP